MIEPNTLRILQYNVNHGKEATLIPLLDEKRLNEFDFLAIQEPWRTVTREYIPSGSQFRLACPPNALVRVCVYINNRIDLDTW